MPETFLRESIGLVQRGAAEDEGRPKNLDELLAGMPEIVRSTAVSELEARRKTHGAPGAAVDFDPIALGMAHDDARWGLIPLLLSEEDQEAVRRRANGFGPREPSLVGEWYTSTESSKKIGRDHATLRLALHRGVSAYLAAGAGTAEQAPLAEAQTAERAAVPPAEAGVAAAGLTSMVGARRKTDSSDPPERPSGQHVPSVTGASSAPGKPFDETYVGKHRRWEESDRPAGVSKELWNGSDRDGKRKLVIAALAAEVAMSDMAPMVVGPLPAMESSPVPRQERTKRRLGAMAAMSAWAGDRWAKTQRYFGDEKQGKRRRERLIAGAVVVVGLGTLALLLPLQSKDHPTGRPPGAGKIVRPPAPGPGRVISPPPTPVPPAPVQPGPEGGAVRPVHLGLAERGASIWSLTVNYAANHGVTLSEEEKVDVVGDILQSNHLTWAGARHLPVGYHFTINKYELNEILKTK